MRPTTLIMLGAAAIFAVVAIFAGKVYFDRQARAPKHAAVEAAKPATAQKTIVVASAAIPFGAVADASNLKEIPWHAEAPVAGAYDTVAQMNAGGAKRQALVAIEANEPVLKSKITGEGERLTLAAMISPGMKAVSFVSSDAQGVGGLVQPNDRVDVLLTQQPQSEEATADVVIQNVRVLAVDQTIDKLNERPILAKVITLEVALEHAQRVALAAQVGKLTLALRRPGETALPVTGRVTAKDLASGYDRDAQTAGTGKARATVTVRRGGKAEDYDVPVDGAAGNRKN